MKVVHDDLKMPDLTFKEFFEKIKADEQQKLAAIGIEDRKSIASKSKAGQVSRGGKLNKKMRELTGMFGDMRVAEDNSTNQ